MATQQSILSLLALTGIILPGCRDRRSQSNPPDSTPPAAGATPPSDSGPSPSGATTGTDSTLSPEVLDVTWQWVSFTTPVEQIKVDAPDHYTIRFGSDGRIAMRADCNRGMGGYSVSADRRLTLKPIALTRAMCPKGSLSDRFAREVGRPTSHFLKDGDLYLELPVDSGTLRFRRQP